MGYSKEVYEEVQKELYMRRTKAWEDLENRKKFFYERFPQAAQIEKQMTSTALSAARAVLKGANSKQELAELKSTNSHLAGKLAELLKSVNLPEDYLTVQYTCPECKDEGFVDGIMCNCTKEMLKKESYNRLSSVSPLELSSFENFSLDFYPDTGNGDSANPRQRMKLILDFCKKYAANFSKNSPGLLFTGNTGLGKTHLSLAIAREVINKGYGVIYISTQNMVSKLEKEKFQINNSNESERHFIDCDLLIIDDLGTEYANAFSNAAIYNVISSRITMNKPTIISTNLSTRELEKFYTPRMVSRLIGNNIRLEFLGVDIRQQILKRSMKK